MNPAKPFADASEWDEAGPGLLHIGDRIMESTHLISYTESYLK